MPKLKGLPVPPGEWLMRGACGTENPDWFTVENPADPRADMATAVCWSRCPVRAECELWGEDDAHADGVRGGYVWRSGIRRSAVLCRGCGRSMEDKYRSPICDKCRGHAAQFSDERVWEGRRLYRAGERSPEVQLLMFEYGRRSNAGKNQRRRHRRTAA